MSYRSLAQTGLRRRAIMGAAVLAVIGTFTALGLAGNFNRQGAVGGVSITADGVVGTFVTEDRDRMVKKLRETLERVPDELNQSVTLRKISLKGLEAACEQYLKNNAGQLPDEIRYLGGLQRIEYVLVYPELNDVVIAGPAEGWKVDDQGNIVGITTGRPVLWLDDLLIALRNVRKSRESGISCSIEPTEDGYRKLSQLLGQMQKSRSGVRDQARAENELKNAFGPQQVKLTGIPANSHLARVLVASDYHMKRLAMKLDDSPVAEITSFIDLIRNSGKTSSNVNPRWWLACNYEPITKSDDGLVFQIRGPGVKVLTENDVVNAHGQVAGTGTKDPMAEKWAAAMTDNYAELSGKDVIFAELRNIMDLCVIAALIEQNDLFSRAGCSVPLLTAGDSQLLTDNWNAPKSVPPHCSFLRTTRGWIVTASGGVQIDAWQVAASTQVNNGLIDTRSKAAGMAGHAWRWN